MHVGHAGYAGYTGNVYEAYRVCRLPVLDSYGLIEGLGLYQLLPEVF